MNARALAPALPAAQALAVPGFAMLQRRLAVGETNDPLEREAERIAGEIVAAPAPAPARPGIMADPNGTTLRRACARCEEKERRTLRRTAIGAGPADASPAVANALAQSGTPLPQGVRAFMEPRFGADFSRVRIHTDRAAARSAAAVNARAYTVGEDVVFAQGAYVPESVSGRRLIAHELAHVVQQSDPHTRANRDVLRRQTLGERFRAGVSGVVAFVAPDQAQFASDLVASVQESPSHVGEFITGELWDTIREHWPSIVGVTVVLFGSQAIIAALGAAPTGVSQVVAAILEIIVLAILFATVAVETYSAIQQGIRWWDAARTARGTPAGISAASREFVRMVWHILMLVLALAGVRARMRTGAAARVSAPFEPPPPPPPGPPALRVISSGAPRSGGRVVSTPRTTAPTTSAPPGGARLAARGGGAARALAPVPEVAPPPVEVPRLHALPDLPASPGATGPTAGPAAPGAAGAIGTAGATATALATDPAERERRSDCGPLPITWPSELPAPEESGIILTRTNAGTREWEGIDDRGPSQQALARQIRAARSLPLLAMDLENPPFPVCGNDTFEPGIDYDAHHIHPLFLGGGDYEDNLCALSHRMHVAGHRRLNDQSAWIDTYRQCGIESGTLTRHPQMTEYVIANEP